MTASQPPRLPKRPITRSFHGDDFVDDYEWIRDVKGSEVSDHIAAENAWTADRLAHLQDARRAIAGEIQGRTKQTDVSVAERDGDYWYWSRTWEGSDYEAVYRTSVASVEGHIQPGARPNPDSREVGEELVFNGNELALDQEFFSHGPHAVSPDGTRVALAVDYTGDEFFELRVHQIKDGLVVDDAVAKIGSQIAWSTDGRSIIYTRPDESWRTFQVWIHEVGADPVHDHLIFQENDPQFSLGIEASRDGAYLVIHSISTTTTEARLVSMADLRGAHQVVAHRRPGLEYFVEVAGPDLLVVHNLNNVGFELASAPLGESNPEDWCRVFAAAPGDRILFAMAFKEFAVIGMRADGAQQLRAISRVHEAGEDTADTADLAETADSMDSPETAPSADSPFSMRRTGSLMTDRAADFVVENGDPENGDWIAPTGLGGFLVNDWHGRDFPPDVLTDLESPTKSRESGPKGRVEVLADLPFAAAASVPVPSEDEYEYLEVNATTWTRSVVIPTEQLGTLEMAGNKTWDTDEVSFTVESLLTPLTYQTWSARTGIVATHKVQSVPGYDPARYVQRREWAISRDGTRVPLTVAHRADLQADGSNPGMLYGYGSYEISSDPWFNVPILSVLDRGVVYVVAHIRGGGELGRPWYDDGKLLKKKNTFKDFVAAADWMVNSGWVHPDRLAAEGGSAGGLLMGAVANMAPERFRVIHARVPFVDALTTILNPELPLTVGEWEEWGNPIESAEVYEYMKGYTPYENVEAVEYPAILASTSLNDIRVFYYEPTKWVAKLRETVTNDPYARPILLKCEMVAGHGGASGRYKRWSERAQELAFILDQIGAL